MLRVHAWLTCVLAAFALAAPASAQYFVRYDIVLDSTPTCDANGVYATATGTYSANLPLSGGNQYVSYSVNGAAPLVQIQNGPGGATSFPLAASTITVLLPVPATPPYTLTAFAFPAINGQPTGLGTQVSAVCNGDGSATLVFANDIPAPSFAVPALQPAMLAAMAALLALMAALGMRRSRRRR